MKRAKLHAPPKPRNPVARSPLLGKGGPHGKSTRAKRRLERWNCTRSRVRATRGRVAMTLSRSYLEAGQMRELYVGAVDDERALTDEQLSASLTATLAVNVRRAPAGGCSATARCCGIRCSRSQRRARQWCTDCTAASACARSRRAARRSARAWCWRSSRAALAAVSPTGCPRRSRSTNCTSSGGARWSSARTARGGCGRGRRAARSSRSRSSCAATISSTRGSRTTSRRRPSRTRAARSARRAIT